MPALHEPVDFEKAVAVIDGEAIQTDAKRRAISLATDGSVEEVKRVLDHMSHANIKIDSLSLHRPTLDDVFMNLTGHKAEKEIGEEEEVKK